MTRLIAFAVGFVIACGADAQTLQLEGDCGAPELQGLVGQTAEIAEYLDFPDRLVSIRGVNDAVTLEYRSNRLNILLDAGVIVAIRCG